MIGDLVLLLNIRLHLFSGKHKSKWIGPFLISKVFPHIRVYLEIKEDARFRVNGKKDKDLYGACREYS